MALKISQNFSQLRVYIAFSLLCDINFVLDVSRDKIELQSIKAFLIVKGESLVNAKIKEAIRKISKGQDLLD